MCWKYLLLIDLILFCRKVDICVSEEKKRNKKIKENNVDIFGRKWAQKFSLQPKPTEAVQTTHDPDPGPPASILRPGPCLLLRLAWVKPMWRSFLFQPVPSIWPEPMTEAQPFEAAHKTEKSPSQTLQSASPKAHAETKQGRPRCIQPNFWGKNKIKRNGKIPFFWK